jgi:hypothetical protein
MKFLKLHFLKILKTIQKNKFNLIKFSIMEKDKEIEFQIFLIILQEEFKISK